VTPSEFSYELMIVSSKKTRKMWLSGDKNILNRFDTPAWPEPTDGRNCHINITRCIHD